MVKIKPPRITANEYFPIQAVKNLKNRSENGIK